MHYFRLTQDHKVRTIIETFRKDIGITLDIERGPWVAGGAALSLFASCWEDGFPDDLHADIDVFVPASDEETRERLRDFSMRLGGPYSLTSYFIAASKIRLKKSDEVAVRNIVYRPDERVPFSRPDAINIQFIESLLMRCQRDDKSPYYPAASQSEIEDVDVPDTLEGLFATFDFTVCQFATDGNMIAVTKDGLYDHQKRLLRLVKGNSRPASLGRANKYSRKGYTVVPGELTRILRIPRSLDREFYVGY